MYHQLNKIEKNNHLLQKENSNLLLLVNYMKIDQVMNKILVIMMNKIFNHLKKMINRNKNQLRKINKIMNHLKI